MVSAQEQPLAKMIERVLNERLDEEKETVRRIVAGVENPEVDEQDYRQLIVSEVMKEVMVDALFAVLLPPTHTHEDVISKALNVLAKNLRRDEWIYDVSKGGGTNGP